MTRHVMSDVPPHPRIVPRTGRGGHGAGAPSAAGAASDVPARSRRSHTPPANEQEGRQPASPIKEATWKWYIPLYFWLGGISAGSWLAVTAEDLAGENDRELVRAGRYLALGSVLAGTTLLVLDLGRRERFLNMLRIARSRSAMSLGSWGLTGFGAFTGLAALLQAAEDGWFGARPRLERWSRGWLGRVTHVMGLPLALFVGSYTGVLLASTSTPSWARRTRVLGPLFLASGVASGVAALSGVLAVSGDARATVQARLARAESVALASELVLGVVSRAQSRSLPSGRSEPAWHAALRLLAMGAGMALPLAIRLVRAVSERASPRRRRGEHRARSRAIMRVLGRRQPSREDLERRGSVRAELARIGVSLAGSLALRYLITQEGRRSARVADDTWAFTTKPERMHTVALRRGEQLATEARRLPARVRPRRVHGTTVGRITVVQEDRIRVVDARGRGYLLTVKKRRASLGQLERWRDERTPVRVRYRGVPDAGAIAERIRPARATGDE